MKMHPLRHKHSAGFSLIELLVAMAIGLIITIAITSVMVSFGNSRLTGTALNDANQSATYSGFVMDRFLRNAGSGFAQRSDEAFGCLINASENGEVRLPRPDDYPEPFNGIPAATRARRLIPVLIEQGAAGNGGDVLTVMAGTSGMGEWPQTVTATTVTTTGLQLGNTLSWRGGDMLLLADPTVPAGCLLGQVSNGFAGSLTSQLPFSGTPSAGSFYAAAGPTVSLANFGAGNDTLAIQLGNAAGNPPQFQMFAADANARLQSFDLLRRADGLVPLADGVIEMRAIYGTTLTTNVNRTRDNWADPGATPFTAAELNTGSAAALINLRQIVAVRVGLILRSSLRERDQIEQPGAVTLFSGLPGQRTRTFTPEEMHYRYRTVEMTIPLRNMLYEQP
jgi:type IV pilus assembly protein PilW